MYSKCRVGTKNLTHQYIEEIVQHFHIICEQEFPELSKKKKYQFILNTQRSYGKTALLLSGGAILGMFHF
jgi:NTE family protein